MFFLLANMLVLGGIEELGWRGFLQPRLQERTSVLTAGLLIGVLWWVWHLPLFFGHQNFSLEPLFVLQYTTFVIGASTVFGAFVNATGGRVLPLMLIHATTNLGALLQGFGGVLDGTALVPLVAGSGLWWLIVISLVGLFGWSMVPQSEHGLSS
ncbi:CPBP family intramembrane glutamic endopeptidase [Natronorubrum halophilum]|uniref:CPBP family intramembrane glutamic endopeptidase n=1 Tax=Natronorubrum halophilum TaxID=1702106 RepID=UPI0023AAF30F|nr:CPBP family intramembrane glutamic endopeptidase [Natronorubrum halophilum]